MMKINGVHIPLKTMIKVQREKRNLKNVGNNNIVTTANKNGDVAVLSYNNQQQDSLCYAHIFKKNGEESVCYYSTSEKGYRKPYVKTIEYFDLVKNNLIFNKKTTIQYNGTSKVPEVISTAYSDVNRDDGVEIVRTFPYAKYSEQYKRPTE